MAGSKTCIESLHDKSGTEIIKTHDFKLTGLEFELNTLKNYHFQDLIENKKIVFDFKLMRDLYPITSNLITIKNEDLPT